MIQLSDVTKKFEAVTAVDNLSFKVREGEIFGLIGTSGCGKTTTLKMINRLEEPTSGTISIEGQSIRNQPAEKLRRGIGYVIQNVGLFPHYSVRENIAITPHMLKWDKDRINKRCDELMKLVGLDAGHFADRKPEVLSGGQQQRVGLARALAADPPIILMDEPFGALDPITKEHIQGEFKKLLQEIQKTVVLVTHDVFEAFALCDRLCLLNEGKKQQTGSPRELLFAPSNSFVRSFFNNHRFQLEMMSITLGDILEVLDINQKEKNIPPLKEEGSDSRLKGDDHAINLKDSFYNAFGQSGSDHITYKVMNSDGKVVCQINADQLLEGFRQARHHLKAEAE